MSGFHTISAILRGQWLMDENWILTHLPMIDSILKGENANLFSAKFSDAELKNINAAVQGSDSGFETWKNENLLKYPMTGSVAGGMFKASRWNSFNDAPENSIAVIPISGPILKNGGDCGEPGAVHYSNWIKAADVSPKIVGILLVVDCPGGQVGGTQTASDAVKSTKKPVVTFIDDGMMASGAVWITAHSNEIYSSHKTNCIGSIGVCTTLYDFTEKMKMQGITMHYINAKGSEDKNKDYFDAIAGNYDTVKAEMKGIRDQFISNVKAGRKGKLTATDENIFSGKMYSSDQAIEFGLIDAYATIEEAAQRVYELANKKQKFYA